MQTSQENTKTGRQQSVPRDWARLIAKLRWIGLEDEAKRLALAVSALPPEKRRDVPFGLDGTD